MVIFEVEHNYSKAQLQWIRIRLVDEIRVFTIISSSHIDNAMFINFGYME